MLKYLMVSCKEATLLMAKNEEGKLSFMQKIHLSVHTSMCALCKKFEVQTAKIAKESKHIEAEDKLSEMAKERMAQKLYSQS
mgnify:FL=1